MRPVLKPALSTAWRDATTLQVGADAERAVVIHGVDAPVAALVAALDGTRDLGGVLETARALGVDERRAGHLLGLLVSAGLLDDAAADPRPLTGLSHQDREQLAPDLASASLRLGTSDGGIAVIAKRRTAVVEVVGGGRVGACLAAVLAAGGVGRVVVTDPEVARLADACPGGLSPADAGRSRQLACRDLLARVAPATLSAPLSAGQRRDLVVLAPVGRLDPARVPLLMRAGTPHLWVAVREGRGVIGPLVLPGRSSCLHCHDLHRADRDPAWPTVAGQLARPPRVTACDTALAVAVAGRAALQALAFLDGHEATCVVDGTLELSPPEGRERRRSWGAHPACGCRWPAA